MALLTPPDWLRRRGPDLLVLLGFLVLALYVTGGMLLNPTHELAINDSDSGLLSWFLAHDAHALANGGRELLVTDDLNAPDGINLMWNTGLLLPGLLLAPLTWMTSGRTTFAVLLWLAPALSAFAAYAALGFSIRGRALVEGRLPRVAGGLLFGFSPALVAQSLGHLQMTLLPLVPLILVLVVEAAVGDRPVRWVGGAAGVLGAAQLLTGEEVLFFTAFVALLVLLGLALSRPREVTAARLRRFGLIGALALGVFGAITAAPLLIQFFGAQSVHGTPFTRDYFKLDVTAFTTPTQLQVISSEATRAIASTYRGGPEEHTGYLGWPLLTFCAVMLLLRWRDLRVRIPILVSVVLSVLALGAHPLVRGRPHDSVELPWSWLIDAPFFEAAIVNRLSLMSALLLGLALAAGLEHVSRQSVVAAGALAALALGPLTPVHIGTAQRPEVPRFFAEGADVIAEGTTVVVAPPAGYGNVDAMRWQAAADFRFRLPGGYFIGPSYDGRAVIGPLPRTLLGLLNEVRDKGAVSLTPEQRSGALIDLEDYDASAVVVGPMPHRAEAEALITDLLGRPPLIKGGVSLWLLR